MTWLTLGSSMTAGIAGVGTVAMLWLISIVLSDTTFASLFARLALLPACDSLVAEMLARASAYARTAIVLRRNHKVLSRAVSFMASTIARPRNAAQEGLK